MREDIKDPGWAAVLSFVFNGLGQLYNGQLKKGLWIIFFSVVSMLVFVMGAVILGFWLVGRVFFAGQLIAGAALFIAGLVLICIIGIYSIVDAYHTAQR